MNADDVRDDEAPLGGEVRKLREAYLAAVPRDSALAVAQHAMKGEVVPGRGNVWTQRRAVAAGLASLAAAAAIVLVVVGRGRMAPATLPVRTATPAVDAAAPIAVEVPEGRNAAVFATRNPLISVVWIY